MGLAASQARLLLLTYRKNDIEAQMMSISNDKLALSRQSSKLSEDYSNALNKTKLTWSSTSSDVNYNLLMTPNSTVTTGQYLLTNTSSGAVLLDSSYLTKLGLDSAGSASQFQSKYGSATQFVAACMGLSETQVSSGVSSVLNGSSSSVESFATSYSDSDVFAELNAMDSDSYTRKSSASNPTNFYTCSTTDGSTKLDSTTLSKAVAALDDEVTSTTGDVSDAVMTVLQANYGTNWSSDLKSKLEEAAAKAQEDTLDFYDSKLQNNNGGITASASTSSASSSSAGTNNVTYNTSGNNALYTDRTQEIKTFLSFFDAECANLDSVGSTSASSYLSQIGNSSTTRSGLGGTSTSCKVQKASDTTSGDANSNNLGDSYEESYYVNLYNAILSKGWQSCGGLDNSDYLQTQITNGDVSLNKISGGNWTSVSSSDTNYPIESTDDTTSINKAEAEYDAAKDKLDYKESQLDVKMNDLDTERSAIETETTSVQKVIDKNIESSFKLFQNG